MPVDPLSLPGYSGTLYLRSYFSYLVTSDRAGEELSYLLLLHNSPTGMPDSQTAGSATAYLLHDLSKSDGSSLTVWGYPGTLGPTLTISMVKVQ